MALGHTWRIVLLNGTGQTLAAGAFSVKVRRWKWSSGVMAWEGSEATLYSGSGGTIANAAYDTGMAAVDNSTDAYLGGTFKLAIVAPASMTSTSVVTAYLQNSTDGGSTWGDNGTGRVVWVKATPTSSTTYTDEVEL